MGIVHKKVFEMALLQKCNIMQWKCERMWEQFTKKQLKWHFYKNVIYHDLLRAVLADIKPQFELFFSSRLFRNQRGFQSLCAFLFNDDCLIQIVNHLYSISNISKTVCLKPSRVPSHSSSHPGKHLCVAICVAAKESP